MSFRRYFDVIKENYDFQVYMLKRHLNYNTEMIDKLEISTGVSELTRLYDDMMQEKITEMGINGIDVKDVSQCGKEYKLWLARKKSENSPKKKVQKVDPEYARKIREHHKREIDRVVGLRMLK